MHQADIENQVIAFLESSTTPLGAAEISPTSSFTEDLGFDSARAVEIICDVEEHFKVELADTVVMDIRNVRDLAMAINNAKVIQKTF